MKKYTGFLLATVGGVVAASAAQAADLPVKAPAYMPPPMANWQGWYVGLHAGANWQRAGYEALVVDGTGFIGGGQIGYNWQNGNAVFGWEADGSGLTGSPGYEGNKGRIEWLSTIRARAGLAVGNTMGYVTGGLAVGGVKHEIVGCCPTVYSNSSTRLGWAVGGGVEQKFNNNWTFGLEALFVDLGARTETLVPNNPLYIGKSTPAKLSNQAIIGRFKVNYKW